MNPFPPPPLPAGVQARFREFSGGAQVPRCWKFLGMLAGGIEMQYAIPNLRGDLDVDFEAMLRTEMVIGATTLNESGFELQDDNIGLVLVRHGHTVPAELVIRYVATADNGVPVFASAIPKN